MTLEKVLYQPTGVGRYLTRDGKIATVTGQNLIGRWKGRIEGEYVSTWWYPNGAHNMFRNHDIVGLA
jgi:hypothetical protein